MKRKSRRARSTGLSTAVRQEVYARDGFACMRCATTDSRTIQPASASA